MQRLADFDLTPRALRTTGLPPGVLSITIQTAGDSGELTLAQITCPLHGARIERSAIELHGHRRIAGPYYKTGLWMLENALRQLRGCRDVRIAEDGCGISIYRPAAEVDALLSDEQQAFRNPR